MKGPVLNKSGKMHYQCFDVSVTMKCNVACKNCIRYCPIVPPGVKDWSEWDLTPFDADLMAADVQEAHDKGVTFSHLLLSGGEAILNPALPQIVRAFAPVVRYFEQGLWILSNGKTKPPAGLGAPVTTWTRWNEKHDYHACAHVDARERDGLEVKSWYECDHYRKDTLNAQKEGYMICCAADGLARYLGRLDLWADRIPTTIAESHVDALAELCNLCPFGAYASHQVPHPMERDNPGERLVTGRFKDILHGATEVCTR
jgi:hypothetical protein